MRKILGYFILTATTAAAVSLASCSNDDDDDDILPTPVVDTTNKQPVDTTNIIPVDTTKVDPGEPVTKQYTLNDVKGIWHIKMADGREEYVEITDTVSRIIRYNTEYPGEDKWIQLKLKGANVNKNVLGFYPDYMTNIYGYKLKSVSATEMVAQPKNQYFENEDFTISDLTYTKVSQLPDRFYDEFYIFQVTMDYTDY